MMTRQQFDESEESFFLNHNRAPQDEDYSTEQLEFIEKVMKVEGADYLRSVLLAIRGGKEIPVTERKGCCGGQKKRFKELLAEEQKKRTLSV